METHTIRNVLITIGGKKIASLPEAVVNLDLNRIEVIIDEVVLSNETIGFLKLTSSEPTDFNVSGAIDDSTLIVEKARVYGFTFKHERGEPPLLKNITILGLSARWKFNE